MPGRDFHPLDRASLAWRTDIVLFATTEKSTMSPLIPFNPQSMSETELDRYKTLLRERLPTDADGRIAYMARANAVKGRVSVP